MAIRLEPEVAIVVSASAAPMSAQQRSSDTLFPNFPLPPELEKRKQI